MEIRYRSDPLLDELEAARLDFEAQFGGDMRKVSEYYMKYQREFADRLITREELDTMRAAGKTDTGKSAA